LLDRNCWHFPAINYQRRFSSSSCCCCCFSFFLLENINKLCRPWGQRQCALCLLSLFHSQVNFKRYMKRSSRGPKTNSLSFSIFHFSRLLFFTFNFLSFSLISYAFRSTRKLSTIVFCVRRPLTFNLSSSLHSFTFIRFHSHSFFISLAFVCPLLIVPSIPLEFPHSSRGNHWVLT